LVPRKAKKKGEMVAVCRPMMGGRVATMKKERPCGWKRRRRSRMSPKN